MAPIYERVQQGADEAQSKRDFDAHECDISLRSAAAAAAAADVDSTASGDVKLSPARSALARAALVTGTVAVVALALSTLCARGFDSFAAVGHTSTVKDDRLFERRRVKRAADTPKYSSLTTTGSQGEPTTQSFVYTTRPIVNPGGYTIGTLTGYVQISATPTNATSSGPTSTPTATGSASKVEEVSVTSTTPTESPIPVPWVSRDHALDDDDAGTEPTAPPPAPSHAAGGARLVKRGDLVQDDDEPPPTTTPPSSATTDRSPAAATPAVTEAPTSAAAAAAADGAEYSTSTDRAGSVYTLVKTTRPIVNPGGYTIGTLDGAWVDVAKQTPRPASANRKKRAATPAAPVPQLQRQHDELRRRNVVDLAAAAAPAVAA